MAIEISMISRDYDDYIEQLQIAATAEFPEWTDFNKSNIGYIYLELLAAQGDQNSYYLNSFIAETFLPTVRRRENAIKILEGRMNYQLGSPKAAVVDLTFEIAAPIANDVIIPEGYQVTSEDGLTIFETVEDSQIDAGNTSVIVGGRNWISQTDPNIDFDNSENQEITLSENDYIDDTAEVEINSIAWVLVDDFTESGPTDKHFKMSANNDLQGVMIFGDGIRGEKPNGTGDATYKTGGGKAANGVQPGEINTITDPILDTLSNQIDVTVTNILSPSGGEEAETIDQARIDAPKQKRSSERTVSIPDYETNAEEVAGVARVLSLGKTEDASIPVGEVLSIITPVGGGVASAQLLSDVENMYLNIKKVMGSSEFTTITATYETITPVGSITPKTNFNSTAVKTAVDAAITDYFDYESLDDKNEPNINYGFKKPIFYISSLVDIIMNVKVDGLKAVDNVTLSSPVGNVAISDRVIPELGSLAGLVVI